MARGIKYFSIKMTPRARQGNTGHNGNNVGSNVTSFHADRNSKQFRGCMRSNAVYVTQLIRITFYHDNQDRRSNVMLVHDEI